MKTSWLRLLIVFAVGVTAASHAGARPVAAPVRLPELPVVPIVFTARAVRSVSVEPHRPPPVAMVCGGGRWFGRCGCFSSGFVFPRRESQLVDPAGAMGAAYLQCRAIQAEVFAPLVRVEFYPDGYFGDWVQQGTLVSKRWRLTDESRIRWLFLLLVESVGAPDEVEAIWLEDLSPASTSADYKRDTGFLPDYGFEFVGVIPLRVELSLSKRRLLVQQGEKWASFGLDPWCAAAFIDLMKRSGQPEKN
jgi:hypothetical protein